MLHGAEGDYVERGGGEKFGAGGLYIDVRQCKGAGDFAEEGGLLVIRFNQREGDAGGPELDGEAGESGAGADVGEAWRLVAGRWSFGVGCWQLAADCRARRRTISFAPTELAHFAWLTHSLRCGLHSAAALRLGPFSTHSFLFRNCSGHHGRAALGSTDECVRPHMRTVGEEMLGGEEGFAEVAGDDFFGVADGGEIDAGVPVEKYIDVRRYTGKQVLDAGNWVFRCQKWFQEFGNATGVHPRVIVDRLQSPVINRMSRDRG